jgi:hypothetical protein
VRNNYKICVDLASIFCYSFVISLENSLREGSGKLLNG